MFLMPTAYLPFGVASIDPPASPHHAHIRAFFPLRNDAPMLLARAAAVEPCRALCFVHWALSSLAARNTFTLELTCGRFRSWLVIAASINVFGFVGLLRAASEPCQV